MNNPLFSQKFRKGFTLIEIMIVISIIGILTNIVYPSYQNYLDRAHDTDIQMIAKEWITLIEQYRTDNDGEIPSQFDQEALSDEYYCIGGADPEYCPIGDTYKHLGLSTFFASTKEGQKALADYPRMYGYEYGGWTNDIFSLYKSTPASFAPTYIYPGIDPTSTTKIYWLWWYLKDSSGGSSSQYNQGSGLGPLADKRCAPGIASAIYGGGYRSLECVYIFR